MSIIKRRIIRVARRDVHLLTAGQGSPLLLVHGSPNTSETLRPLIDYLSREFLVLAPDTPGNGESSPLPEDADSPAAFAHALAELLDVLGLGQVGAYGFHSGATFVSELARLYPQRVSALVCEGLPLWNAREARKFDEGFLESYAPVRDGAHLMRLWTRLIDQNWYFPWHLGDKGRAVSFDLTDVGRLHQRAMELLVAGDTYQMPYRTVLQADGIERLAAVSAPTLVLYRVQDVLARHMRRVPTGEHIHKAQPHSQRTLYQRIRAWFAEHTAPVAHCEFRQEGSRFIDLPAGQVFVTGETDPNVLWLHDVGESGRAAPEGCMSFDLPGHGLTSMECPLDIQELLPLVRQILDALHVDTHASGVLGAGLGYQLAAVLAGKQSQLTSAPCDAPDIAPRWDGGHLTAAWHFCRFRSQYRRWDRRTPEQRAQCPLPDAHALHERMIDVLRTGDATLRRVLPYSMAYPT